MVLANGCKTTKSDEGLNTLNTHCIHILRLNIASLLQRSQSAILFLQWSSCVGVNVCTGAVLGVGVGSSLLPFMLSDWGWLMTRLTLFPYRCSCYPFNGLSFPPMLPFFYLFILLHLAIHSVHLSFLSTLHAHNPLSISSSLYLMQIHCLSAPVISPVQAITLHTSCLISRG